MRYQVPQFIEIEDKLFGPLTLKQFIYLAGGGGLCLFFFTLLPLYLSVLLMLPVVALAAALAFYKVNGRPFIEVMQHAISFFIGHKLYLWKQRENKIPAVKEEASGEQPLLTALKVPKLSESKLKDLSWSLNIKDRTAMGITSQERSGFEI